MPRLTYADQQLQIQKEISRLKKQAEALQAKHRKPIIASIIKSMKEYDISPQEIADAYSSGKGVRGAKAKVKTTGAKAVAPKYRHPETGQTWSGRGKAPRWLATEEENGASREGFLIK